MSTFFKPALLKDLKHYDRKTFSQDILSGIIVGIVALPLAIAFGIASGVSPEQGIITAIVAGFIISVFGGSKVQIGGPTGAFIVIISGIITEYGIQGLMIATLMAGVFLVLMGIFRLGTVIKYIPYPIIVGFTSGIALTIFTTQVKDLLGISIQGAVPADFISKWSIYFQNLGSIDMWSTLVGLASIALIILTPKVSKVIPGSLVAIIMLTAVVAILKSYGMATGVDTIGDRFNITSEMPDPKIPEMSWLTIKGLISPAITIAILGAIESLLSATVADGIIGDRHNSNQELIGQGLANIISPVFGGIPATGAIARTMTNINNGGKTPVAGIVHAVVLLAVFIFLMPLAQYIPMACLAGVLVVVSYNMSGWRIFRQMLKNPKSDITVLLITFILTVIFDLTVAIEVGLMLACLLCMRRMAETTQVSVITDEIDPNNESDMEIFNEEHLIIPPHTEVYEINGPYFFGIANKFDDVMEHRRKRPKVRIIRMRKVPFIDSTGMHNLSCLVDKCHQKKIQVILSGVTPKVDEVLRKNGFEELLGADNICPHINIALERARQKVTQ